MAKYDVYQEITNAIIDRLEDAGTWKKSWACFGTDGLPTRVTGRTYRGINRFILMVQSRSNPTWLTYNQAKKLGGMVRKGERGTKIVFYKPIIIEDKETGEETSFPLVKSFSVFNVEQIDDLPTRFYPGPSAPQHTEPRLDDAETYVAATKATITHGGDRAYYRPSTDGIHVPEFDAFFSAEAYYGTLLHELVHWTGAKKRCDRNLKNSCGSKDYAREELVAELGAAFLCGGLNIENEVRDDHVQYLASWLKVLKEDKKAIFRAASAAQKAVDFLDDLQPVKLEVAA
jgi:antirestriction protein ArdC